MKIFLLLTLALVFGATCHGQRLFLVAGQSNAAGVGDYHLSPQCPPNSAFEYRLSGDDLLPLKDPVGENEYGFDKAKTGSAWPAFALRYHELSNNRVFIVQAAKGGSTLNPGYRNYLRWDSLGWLWSAAVAKARKAMDKTELPLSGIIWSQGEADGTFINAQRLTGAEYQAQLKNLIGRFRREFGPTLPFYIIQTGFAGGEDPGGFEIVQSVQEQICRELPYTYLVYSFTRYFPEFNLMTDYVHYNQHGYNVLGKTVAEVIDHIDKTKTFQPPVYENVIYPNPASGQLSIQFVNVALEDRVSLEIVNMMGNSVAHFDGPLKKEVIEMVDIDLSDLADGIYFLHTQLNDHTKIERINVLH